MAVIDVILEWIRTVIKEERVLKHHMRTKDYLLMLSPNASLEAQVAALTHDIERSLPGAIPQSEDKESHDEKYLRKHGAHSAKHVIKFLKQKNISLNYDRIKYLITNHEIGGDEECGYLRDADSLSFFEVIVPLFLEIYSREYSKHKFQYMFNRIGSEKAKQIAKPMYEKALSLCD